MIRADVSQRAGYAGLMAKTTAERVSAHRKRQREELVRLRARVTELEAGNAALQSMLDATGGEPEHPAVTPGQLLARDDLYDIA